MKRPGASRRSSISKCPPRYWKIMRHWSHGRELRLGQPPALGKPLISRRGRAATEEQTDLTAEARRNAEKDEDPHELTRMRINHRVLAKILAEPQSKRGAQEHRRGARK